jgi:hypothetical protein
LGLFGRRIDLDAHLRVTDFVRQNSQFLVFAIRTQKLCGAEHHRAILRMVNVGIHPGYEFFGRLFRE